MADIVKKSLVWEYINKQYYNNNINEFKLNDLTEHFSTITQVQLQLICDEFINENKFLPPERSRIVKYQLNSSILPAKHVNDENNVIVLKKSIEKSIIKSNKPIENNKPKPLKDISVNIVNNQTQVIKKSKNVDEHNYIQNDQVKLTALPVNNNKFSDDIVGIVMKELLQDIPNPDTDLGYISKIKPRCLEFGLSSNNFDEIMDYLMQENRIYINQDEVFIL